MDGVKTHGEILRKEELELNCQSESKIWLGGNEGKNVSNDYLLL